MGARCEVMKSVAARPFDSRGLVTGIGLGVVHLGALCALIPGTFSWSAVAVMFVLYYITGAWGITLGFHRTLTHRSLRVSRFLEPVIAIVGVLALQGGPIEWIATHRAHHANTDREGDPHDIHRGAWWSHVAWLYRRNDARLSKAEQRAAGAGSGEFEVLPVPREHVRVLADRAGPRAAGDRRLVVGDLGRVRALRRDLSHHVARQQRRAHDAATRRYRTGDKSTNNWWVAILAWGEGWHNNHHAFPFSARHGLRWFEVDATWATIRVLAWLQTRARHQTPDPRDARPHEPEKPRKSLRLIPV